MTVAIIILGHINDEQGNLSAIARSRCEIAFKAFNELSNTKILCTGGFGDSFNVTRNSHGRHLQEFLVAKGLPSDVFLDVALSTYTFEDALLSKPILDENTITKCVLVTSDFHMARAKLVFEHVMPNIEFTFIEAKTDIKHVESEAELTRLIEHEKYAIKRDRDCCI